MTKIITEGIDLNMPKYSSPVSKFEVFKEKVLEIPDELIYFRYLGSDFKVGGVCSSPFRKDKNPSFGIFRETDGTLVYNDLGFKDSGNSFDFVYKYYKEVLNVTNINDMLVLFNEDMKNFNEVSKKIIDPTERNIRNATYKKKKFKLEVKVREFAIRDEMFWGRFGISVETLKLFNVFPIFNYFINDTCFRADSLAYVYIEIKDSNHFLKIYQPHNTKRKWISNTNFSVHQGYRLLPPKGELLIITKSLKDVMALKDTLKIDAVAVQGEKSRIKDTVREEYKNRFTTVLSLFDNDREGNNLFNYFKENYNIDGILIPTLYNSKDYSDLVRNIGVKEAINVLQYILLNKINNNGGIK